MGRLCAITALGLLLALSMSATDLSGIWMGQVAGRNDEMQDLAFKFKVKGDTLTGTMFGDEYDLPISDGKVSGDEVSFSVTTTNYYSMTKMKFVFSGTIKGNEIELTRVREGGGFGGGNRARQNLKQTFSLKRLT